MRQAFGVARYRFRVTFHDRWGGYLTIVLLVGLLGGLAMGAIAGARRTQSSFPTLLTRTNSSNLFGLTGVYNPAIGLHHGYDPSLMRTISRLPYVKDVKSLVEVNLLPLKPNGSPLLAAAGQSMDASVNGEEFNQDRIIVTGGRLPDPRRANEFITDTATAKILGFHLGQVITFLAFSNKQMALLQSVSPTTFFKKVKPILRIRIKLVGDGVVQASNLMQDQVDSANSGIVLFTPVLADRLLKCCVNTTLTALQLEGGNVHQTVVESELTHVLPKALPIDFTQLSVIEAKAEQTIKPESIALGAFGLIAALAMLVIAGQVIGRRQRLNANDVEVLRALGAGPMTTYVEGLIGILGAVLAGSLLAVLVAIALSPLALLGPIRPYIPNGVNFDWIALGVGLAVVVVGLGSVAVAAAVHSVSRRASPRREWSGQRGSSAARAAASANLPVSAVTGIRLALEPGTGRNTVPVRSAILGAVFAVVIVTSTIIFGASLHTLVTKPTLYGWNFTYEMNGGGGLGDIPAARAAKLLDQSPYVQAWTGVNFGNLNIDGQIVPVMGASPRSAVGPPLLSGHAFDGTGQVVLGALTMAQLHKKVGDTVEVRSSDTVTTRLRIVGTATLPTIGIGGATHLEMGSGALLSYQLIPAGQRNLYDGSPGPNAILIRVKPGANQRAAFKSFQAMLTKLGGNGNGGQMVGVQRPAQIINYSSLGSIPTVLGGALAGGAVVALGLTLVTSVRRRRRDLALLKILGFTKRQLAAAIAWQSSVAVGIGTAVGVPLGIVLGNFIWDLFAREINAVPRPTVPLPSIALIVVGSLVLANVVAAIPARIAARTPTALLLRAE